MSSGLDPKALLKQAGFSPKTRDDKDARVPFDAIAHFFELAADEVDDDLLGFHFGQRCDLRDAGLIAYVGVNSPTLRQCMKNIASYRRVLGDATEFDLSRLDAEGRITYSYHLPVSKARRQYVEWAATGLISTLRQITESAIWCEHVSFIHPRNARTPEIERFFGCEISFGARTNTITFKKTDLEKPIVNADRKLLDLLESIAAKTLARRGTNQPLLEERIEKAIMAKMISGDVTLGNVAPELGMSARSLSRHLKNAGLSYSSALANLREALATRYLRDSDLSITQIAFLLGYADTSTFSTAFHQWLGMSPSAFRDQGAASS